MSGGCGACSWFLRMKTEEAPCSIPFVSRICKRWSEGLRRLDQEPWRAHGDTLLTGGEATSEDWGTGSTVIARGLLPAYAEFIAHARADVVSLIAELRWLLDYGRPE